MEPMMNHTPGPWKTSTKKDRVYVLAQNEPICEMLRQNEHTPCAANARLIAAAPELLKLLQELLEWWDYDQSWRPADEMELAREIIKKARGE